MQSELCIVNTIGGIANSRPIQINEGFKLAMATVFEPQLIEQAYKLTDPTQNSKWDWDDIIELDNIVNPLFLGGDKVVRILSTSRQQGFTM